MKTLGVVDRLPERRSVDYAVVMQPNLVQKFQLALHLQQQGRLDEAAETCASLVQDCPDEADPMHLLGLIRKQQKRYDEAEALMRRSTEKAPGNAVFLANLGNLLRTMGRLADAEQAYREALSFDTNFRQARLGLVRALNDAGHFDAGEKEALDLVASTANDAEAHAALGDSLAGLSRFEDAEASYREALRIAPDYGVARHNLGAMLARASRTEESLAELEKAAADGIRGIEIDFNRASGLMKLYRFDEGETLLATTLRDEPEHADAQKLLAEVRYMRGEEDYADELARAVARFPANVEIQMAYAEILHGANRLVEAEEALSRALQRVGSHPRLLAMRATVHQEAGRFDKALDDAEAAINASPEDPLLADLKIDALMSLGRADEAMPLVEAARRRAPDHQWYIAIESTAARLLGDPRYQYLCDYDEMIRIYDLEAPSGYRDMREFQETLVPALQERHQFHAHPLKQSLRFGTQTPRNLIGDPDPRIQQFIASLDKPVAEYRAAIGYDDAHPLRRRNRGKSILTGCWSVRLQKGGFHVNHVHPEGWVSSAYYAEVPDEVSDEKARSGWIRFGETRYPVPGATPERYVQPKVGRLVLFPSYMWHGTTPIHGNQPRMTCAFDVITRGPGTAHQVT